MNTVCYPSPNYLRDLKDELKSNDCVKINIKTKISRKMLKTPLKEFVENKSWSVLSTWKFIFYPKILYSLLVLNSKNYSLEFDGDQAVIVKKTT